MTTGGGGCTLYPQLQLRELAHKLNCIEGKDKVPKLNQVPHHEIVSIP
jgi:hypothetical protein